MNNSFVFFIALVRPKQDDGASPSPLLQHLCEMQSAQLTVELLKYCDEYCSNTLYIHTLRQILRFIMASFSLYHFISFISSPVPFQNCNLCCCLQTNKQRRVFVTALCQVYAGERLLPTCTTSFNSSSLPLTFLEIPSVISSAVLPTHVYPIANTTTIQVMIPMPPLPNLANVTHINHR